MNGTDRPDELEIAAYVDGEMAPMRRAEIEDLAARDRELAGLLEEEMALTEALRRGQAGRGRWSDESQRQALRLQRRLRTHVHAPVVRRAAAAVACVALGWGLHAATQPMWEAPTTVTDARFVDAAREALRVAALDTGPQAPGEPIARKIDRLEAVTDVEIPKLPANWRVLGVQVQPFNGRPSVVVTAESPVLGAVTLVAAPMDVEGAVPPTPAPDGAVPTVYWQSGGTAYALMGAVAPTRLKSVADGIEVATRRKPSSRERG